MKEGRSARCRGRINRIPKKGKGRLLFHVQCRLFERFKAGRTPILFAAAFVTVFLGWSTAASAAEVALRLETASPQIELGDRMLLKVIQEGRADAAEPSLPEVPGLDIMFQGRAQSVQIMNLQVKTSKIFTYIVSPQRVGDFTLGPARLEEKGKVIESNSVALKVVESGNNQPAASTGNNFLVEAGIDNGQPYIGQQITLLLRFARTADAPIRNAGYDLPELSNFWTEGIESRREYSKAINGKDYMVTEVSIPLFPINEGDLLIAPIIVRYDELIADAVDPHSPLFRDPFGRGVFDDDFFKMFRAESIVKRVARTTPIPVHVKPLPPEGKPDDFKGGVGKFSLNARLSNDEVKVGESVTLTLTLSGEGNIRDLPDPKVEMDAFKVYSDNPSTNVKNYHDKVVGEKVYKLALVAQQAGQITIPEVAIPYFNPDSKRYEYASSGLLELKAQPAENESLVLRKPDSAKELSISGNTDILPIHERIGKIEFNAMDLWLARLRPLVYPLPLLIYAACFVFAKRRNRLKTDVAYRRFKFAAKTAEKCLASAEDAYNRKDWDEVFSKSSKAIIEYLAAKMNMPAGGLTPGEMENILISHNIPRQIIKEIKDFLDSCDFGRFTASMKNSTAAHECVVKARQLLERLEEKEILAA